MNFNPIDVLIFIILLFFTINGTRKGFIKEISKIIGILLGLFSANNFTPYFKHYLNEWISDETGLYVATYILIFIIITITISIISSILQKFFELILLGWLNRLLGFLLGFLKGLMIISLLVFCIEAIPNTDKTLKRIESDSILFKICNNLKEIIIRSISFNDQKTINTNVLENLIKSNTSQSN